MNQGVEANNTFSLPNRVVIVSLALNKSRYQLRHFTYDQIVKKTGNTDQINITPYHHHRPYSQ